MFKDADRRALVRAARCFHSLDGYQTLHAMATLAGLKRLQDAFDEHVKAVRQASQGAPAPGIALFWLPESSRGDFSSAAQVRDACIAIEAENPSLVGSLTVLWQGAEDTEVAAAWSQLKGFDWSTSALLALDVPCASSADEDPIYTTQCVDVVGETYEMLKNEIGSSAGRGNGEYFTPEPVGNLMAKILSPQPREVAVGTSVLDPCCGSGRLLVLAAAEVIQQHGHLVQETGAGHPLGAGHRLVLPPPMLFVGQDIAPHGPAMGQISLTALGYLNAVFVVRNSLSEPVTTGEVAGIIQERAHQILALQPQHLVTEDVKTRMVVHTPTLVDGPVQVRKAKRERRLGAAPAATSLESF